MSETISTDGTIPDPVKASITPEAYNDRISYENWVNAEAESFAELAKHRFLDAVLAGCAPADVSIVVAGEHDGQQTDIAPETAIAFAADAGLKPYAEWNHTELADECRKRGLKVSGTNDELLERLEEDDAKDAEAALSEDE